VACDSLHHATVTPPAATRPAGPATERGREGERDGMSPGATCVTQRLACGRPLVGRVVVRHAVHQHAPEAVTVRAPVRIDPEAALVDRTAHDVRVAVEMLRERGELIVWRLRRPSLEHRHVQASERKPRQLREPLPRYDAEGDLIRVGVRARARARARAGARVRAGARARARVSARSVLGLG
jgi:hypothetical protein